MGALMARKNLLTTFTEGRLTAVNSPAQSDTLPPAMERNRSRGAFGAMTRSIDELAEKYGVTPTAIAVAWITRHPANVQVVLGTTKPSRVAECAAGSSVPLTREEWYRLFRTAGHTLP